jgi:hypothetical protein
MQRRTRRGQPDLRLDRWVNASSPEADDPAAGPDDPAAGPDEDLEGAELAPRPPRSAPSLAGLSVAGFTRRRVAWLIAGLMTVWIVVVFTRQVGDASAKAAQADEARAANVSLQEDVVALQHEYELVQQPTFIEQQAHGLGLGGDKDHAFTLSPDASPLPANAPGSASVRLGAVPADRSPLDSWLDLLFGPTPGN